MKVLLLVLVAGCAGGRAAGDVATLPPDKVKFAIPAPCPAERAQAAVASAGDQLDLSVETSSSKPGEPWVLHRGSRLNDPALWYRVDVVPADDGSIIRVYAIPVPLQLGDTQETIAKPAALAMRIIAGCTGGAP
jgi:hypothetical protein